MVRAQHPQAIGQYFLKRLNRFLHLPRIMQRRSETTTSHQRAGVVRAQHPEPIGQHRLERLDGLLNPPRALQRRSEVMAYP